MDRGPARAGFLGPGRITLGGEVAADPQSARGPLLKTTPIVASSSTPTESTLSALLNFMGTPQLLDEQNMKLQG